MHLFLNTRKGKFGEEAHKKEVVKYNW